MKVLTRLLGTAAVPYSPPNDLVPWDREMKWTVGPGDFAILPGSSSVSLKSSELAVR